MSLDQLQKDLNELGFLIAGKAPPVGPINERDVSMAVREFQRYAKMPSVAQEGPNAPGTTYEQRLTSTPNTAPYAGFMHGQVDDPVTLQLIQTWKRNSFRCPVVIQARRVEKGLPAAIVPGGENIWRFNEMRDKTARMFVFDFSGYYTPVSDPVAPVVVGTFITSKFGGGPESVPPHHTKSEVLPLSLVGVDLPQLTDAQRLTFKVVRAVSDQECIGFFDSINAYDTALMSIGLYNWTLGVHSGIEKAELPAFYAYLQDADKAAFDKAIGQWGVGPQDLWNGTGTALFEKVTRKYLTTFCHQDPAGTLQPVEDEDADYYRSWHWFYRLEAAARTVDGFRHRMWHMARIRVRDIRATPWNSPDVPMVPEGDGYRPATLGDVYTSPSATAILVRWHVLSPDKAPLIVGGHSSATLQRAFARANSPRLPGSPLDWGDCHEHRLIQGLLDQIVATGHPELNSTTKNLVKWPNWTVKHNKRGFTLPLSIGKLETDRNSLKFDDSELPAPPV